MSDCIEWNITEEELPNDNTRCVVISEGGVQQTLKFYKGRWFQPDMSTYVYFTPKFWRYE